MAVGRLAASINVDASVLMKWDADTVAGLLVAQDTFDAEVAERAKAEAARRAAAGH